MSRNTSTANRTSLRRNSNKPARYNDQIGYDPISPPSTSTSTFIEEDTFSNDNSIPIPFTSTGTPLTVTSPLTRTTSNESTVAPIPFQSNNIYARNLILKPPTLPPPPIPLATASTIPTSKTPTTTTTKKPAPKNTAVPKKPAVKKGRAPKLQSPTESPEVSTAPLPLPLPLPPLSSLASLAALVEAASSVQEKEEEIKPSPSTVNAPVVGRRVLKRGRGNGKGKEALEVDTVSNNSNSSRPSTPLLKKPSISEPSPKISNSIKRSLSTTSTTLLDGGQDTPSENSTATGAPPRKKPKTESTSSTSTSTPFTSTLSALTPAFQLSTPSVSVSISSNPPPPAMSAFDAAMNSMKPPPSIAPLATAAASGLATLSFKKKLGDNNKGAAGGEEGNIRDSFLKTAFAKKTTAPLARKKIRQEPQVPGLSTKERMALRAADRKKQHDELISDSNDNFDLTEQAFGMDSFENHLRLKIRNDNKLRGELNSYDRSEKLPEPPRFTQFGSLFYLDVMGGDPLEL